MVSLTPKTLKRYVTFFRGGLQNRIGTVEEIAATALYLASPAGGFTTGQNIVVDGGTLISDQ